jgi:hypothetical protein
MIMKTALARSLAPVLALTAGLAGQASAFPVFPMSYSLSCTGTRSGGAALSLVGRIQFNNLGAAVGSATFVNGSIIQFTSFTATFTNGNANAQGVGGNGIPQGCFRGTASFGGDTFGVLSQFFGCYHETMHGFELTQTASSLGAGTALTCRGTEM